MNIPRDIYAKPTRFLDRPLEFGGVIYPLPLPIDYDFMYPDTYYMILYNIVFNDSIISIAVDRSNNFVTGRENER